MKLSFLIFLLILRIYNFPKFLLKIKILLLYMYTCVSVCVQGRLCTFGLHCVLSQGDSVELILTLHQPLQGLWQLDS